MFTITGTIEGVAPLLFSRPFKVIEPKQPGKMTDEDREQEPFKRLHLDAEKGVYIPRGALKGALLEGVKLAGIKDGKRSAFALMEATIFPQHDLYLGKQTYDGVLEIPGRVPPRTGPLVLLRYPQFNEGWSCAFTLIQVQNNRGLAEQVRAGLESAGLLVGLGSWRPEYGRFIVRGFEVVA